MVESMEICSIGPELMLFIDAMKLVDGKYTDHGIEARVSKNTFKLCADSLCRVQVDMGRVLASNLGPDIWILQSVSR
jgi:hypothetical protein